MEIKRIYEDRLFTIHYSEQTKDELSRLMGLWTNVEYVYSFVKKNYNDLDKWVKKNYNKSEIVEYILSQADVLDEMLTVQNKNEISILIDNFQPLHSYSMSYTEFEQQKNYIREDPKINVLRLYALKIEDCYLISGGSIKFTKTMNERSHTENELKKLNRCRDYLRQNHVFDDESFYEFYEERL